jgi:cytochrome b pre-mRNA-processing protein 3
MTDRSNPISRTALPAQGSTGRWWRRLWPFDAAAAARRRTAHDLYGVVVAQARTEALYREMGVPDTPDGRFEMIGLHAILVIRALRRRGAAGHALAQALFDLLWADMDRSLREMGVGDLSVGKHVKRLAGSFFARARSLEPLLDSGEPVALARALGDSVYPGATAPEVASRALAHYVIRQDEHLAAGGIEAALAGRGCFAAMPDGTAAPGPEQGPESGKSH